DRLLDALPDHVELPLERVLVRDVRPRADEDLTDGRHDRLRLRSGRGGLDRHATPAEEGLTLLRDDLLDDRDAGILIRLLRRQEDHPDAVTSRRGRRGPPARAFTAEEPVRHLHEDAGAVAGERVAAARAAVGQVLEDLEALLDDVVRALTLHVDDEADAARVALRARVEEPAGRPFLH